MQKCVCTTSEELLLPVVPGFSCWVQVVDIHQLFGLRPRVCELPAIASTLMLQCPKKVFSGWGFLETWFMGPCFQDGVVVYVGYVYGVQRMSFVDCKEKLWQEMSAIIADEGLVLYDLERLGSAGLRVSVSKPQSDTEADSGEDAKEEGAGARNGVTTGDCTRVCRRLLTYFAVEGEALGVSSEPQLEVSSPGINRRLRLEEHFRDAVGERVKVRWRRELEGKPQSHTTVGVLAVFDEACLSLVDEKSGDELNVLLNEVRKAQVDFPF